MKNAPKITGMSTLSNRGPNNRYCVNSLCISQSIDDLINNPIRHWLEGKTCIVEGWRFDL